MLFMTFCSNTKIGAIIGAQSACALCPCTPVYLVNCHTDRNDVECIEAKDLIFLYTAQLNRHRLFSFWVIDFDWWHSSLSQFCVMVIERRWSAKPPRPWHRYVALVQLSLWITSDLAMMQKDADEREACNTHKKTQAACLSSNCTKIFKKNNPFYLLQRINGIWAAKERVCTRNVYYFPNSSWHRFITNILWLIRHRLSSDTNTSFVDSIRSVRLFQSNTATTTAAAEHRFPRELW